MVLRSSIAGFTALLVMLGAMPLADAASKAKAKAKAVSAPAAEPESAPPAAPAPEPEPAPSPAPAPQAFVPEQSGVISASDPAVTPALPSRQEMVKPINAPLWGGGLRARWISIPRWFLGAFTRASRAVSSYGFGIEGIRRKYDPEDRNRMAEMSLAVGYQNMSAPDGNWLGRGKTASVDTDWVQFKNFGFWTIDFSYLFRQYFNDVVGIHYGGGLGLAIIQGDILRTSSSESCTANNLSSPECRPTVCLGASGCTEKELKDSEHRNDYPETARNPRRFREGSIPPAIPLINLVAGFDFRIPTVPGLEFRAEGGFYNALFVGGGVAYMH
jgi:hypothetical protein